MSYDYKESFEQMKTVGSLAAETLDEITPYVKPGITTGKLDKICYEFIRDNGGYSAPLFYRGFPKSCCTSVNHVVCHGIPTEKPFFSTYDWIASPIFPKCTPLLIIEMAFIIEL